MDPELWDELEDLAETLEQVAEQLGGLEGALPLPPEVRPVAGWLVWLLRLFARHGYALAFAGAFVESTAVLGLLLPGGSAVALAGVAARTGGLFLPVLIVLGTAGMVLGALVNYALGRSGADRFLRRGRLGRSLNLELDKAGALLHRHGWWAMTLSYVFGAGRSALSIAAGAGHLPLRRFLAYQIPAALLWSTLFAGGGYVLARQWQTIESTLRRTGWAGGVVFVTIAAAWLLRRALANQRRDRAAVEAEHVA
jgi:membrane protein DedA with SNARE-associated domain